MSLLEGLALDLAIAAAAFWTGYLFASSRWQARWIRYLESVKNVYVPPPGEPEGHVTLPGPSPEETASRLGMAEAVEKLADHYLELAREMNRPLDREKALEMARVDILADVPGGALT